jgi:hypothetical protein
MPNLLKRQGIPHKGWALDNLYDAWEDGQSEDETS